MGGLPLAVLNLLALPAGLSPEVAREMLRGSGDVVREAGALVVGGHTIEDVEPKFGLAVFGMVHPLKVVRNVGALPGDVLVLTKAIGTGIITTALKRGLETEDSAREVIESMSHLNRASSAAMTEVGVHAATDVTGFGLIGHLHEMLVGSGVSARVDTAGVPVFDRALDYAADLVCPGRTRDLLEFLDPVTRWGDAGIEWRSLLADPQTSGGLLMAVARGRLDSLMAALAERGERGHVIGEVLPGEAGIVTVS
jgi:selenide,water dikinase